jgi:DNA-binding XRE family transcriptional regulator
MKNTMQSWRVQMEDVLGDKVTQAKAAHLLGKTERMIRAYEQGKYDVPLDLRLLMSALADGYRPHPWAPRK